MIQGADLRDATTRLTDGLLRAAKVLRGGGDRDLYELVLISGNRVEVHLNLPDRPKIAGELTAVTDAGLCVAYYDEDVWHESLLQLVPYSSILCVIELPPLSEDDGE